MRLFKPDIAQLVRKAVSGDQRAFSALYELHVDALFCFLNQFSENRTQTADWVQTSFIKAFHSLHRFEGRSSFKTWLFTIGLNEVRTAMRGTHLETIDVLEDQMDSGYAEEKNPLPVHDLKIWLRVLDVRQRSVLLLAEVEGYSHAEIAEMLSITESTSRSILSRAKATVRKRIQSESNYGKHLLHA
jgi:RNA polymerase sigma-70 factor (ECF subfamily)